MKVFNVGPDKLGDWELDRVGHAYRWFVYRYEEGCWDGSGKAVGMKEDGTLWLFDLSHCSCYGPLDNAPDQIDEDTLLSPTSVYDPDVPAEVVAKVRELLLEA